MPINDFNTLLCAFRVIKNKIINQDNFMRVFNKASISVLTGNSTASKTPLRSNTPSNFERPKTPMRSSAINSTTNKSSEYALQ